MLVNLIKVTGETEEDTTEVKCSLESDISTSEGQSTQGDFKCTLFRFKRRILFFKIK